MLYHYRALCPDGRIQRGTLNATHSADLERQLRGRELTLLTARTKQQWSFWAHRPSLRELAAWCFQLEQLLQAGVPLADALRGLRDHTDTVQWADLLTQILETIEGGGKFSQALEHHTKYFSPLFITLVRAGEVGGVLPEVLQRLGQSLQWQDELRAQRKRALFYPAIVLALTIAVTSFLLIYLVPQLLHFLQETKQTLPLQTQILISLSTALSYGKGGPAIALLSAPLLFSLLAKRAGPLGRLWQHCLWHIPIIGSFWKKLLFARLADCLALLYSTQVPLLTCLSLGEDILTSTPLKQPFSQVREQVNQGSSISRSLKQAGIFSPLALQMLRAGEQTGSLELALQNIAAFYHRDIKDSAERLQALIEPVLTSVLGLLMLWVMSAILTPVFNSIGHMQ